MCRSSPSRRYECSDGYAPLIALWQLIKDDPISIGNGYETRWRCLRSRGGPYYLEVRDAFNTSYAPCDLFFLLQTCKNGFFRFNRRGEFKGTYGSGRFGTKGTRPEKVGEVLTYWSGRLRDSDVQFRMADYRSVVTASGDVMYLDPPYQSVRRLIYAGEFDIGQFFDWVGRQGAAYFMSLDGFDGEEDRTVDVPHISMTSAWRSPRA